MYLHQIYGVVVGAGRPLPAARASGAPQIVITEHPFRRRSPLPPNPRGYSYERLASGDIHVSWSDLFDFVVSADGARIDVYAEPTGDREPVYTYLISQVISVALLQQGIESLHASAVEMHGKACVLIGDSGYGKSTLTAALLRSGARLITDDLLVIKERDDVFDVAPGAFRLKLAPATAAALALDWKGVPMADGSGKLVYLLDPAQCVTNELPIATIYLIEPHAPRAFVEDVTAAEALRALLGATFNPLHDEPERLQRLLHDAQKTARGTCIRRLHVPRDLDNINAVVALI